MAATPPHIGCGKYFLPVKLLLLRYEKLDLCETSVNQYCVSPATLIFRVAKALPSRELLGRIAASEQSRPLRVISGIRLDRSTSQEPARPLSSAIRSS